MTLSCIYVIPRDVNESELGATLRMVKEICGSTLAFTSLLAKAPPGLSEPKRRFWDASAEWSRVGERAQAVAHTSIALKVCRIEKKEMLWLSAIINAAADVARDAEILGAVRAQYLGIQHSLTLEALNWSIAASAFEGMLRPMVARPGDAEYGRFESPPTEWQKQRLHVRPSNDPDLPDYEIVPTWQVISALPKR